MRILVTSGGTKVAIDPVRHITNLSGGRFGAKIARAALAEGAEVIYLGARHGETPFRQCVDLAEFSSEAAAVSQMEERLSFFRRHRDRYRYVPFTDFHEYHDQIRALVQTERPDVVILAAAVSDYLVSNYAKEKVRTQTSLEIHLEGAPKIISSIRQWHPQTVLVGFKLLVEANEETLVAEARKGMQTHGANFVVANTLASIRKGAHEVLVVEPDGTYAKHTENLAQAVVDRAKKEMSLS